MQLYLKKFENYPHSGLCSPLFFMGDALDILKHLPEKSFDFCMTSPPYWNKREYPKGGIGLWRYSSRLSYI
jgi:DNA modification methylase